FRFQQPNPQTSLHASPFTLPHPLPIYRTDPAFTARIRKLSSPLPPDCTECIVVQAATRPPWSRVYERGWFQQDLFQYIYAQNIPIVWMTNTNNPIKLVQKPLPRSFKTFLLISDRHANQFCEQIISHIEQLRKNHGVQRVVYLHLGDERPHYNNK